MLATGDADLSDKRRRYVTIRLDPVPIEEAERRLDALAASGAHAPDA